MTPLNLVNVNVFLKDPRMKCCFVVSKSLDTYESCFSLVLGTLRAQEMGVFLHQCTFYVLIFMFFIKTNHFVVVVVVK